MDFCEALDRIDRNIVNCNETDQSGCAAFHNFLDL